jgi:hypothetical protein
MMQHQIDNHFKVFVNLNGSGAENVEVANFWGEYSANEYLNFRIGKIYRKFGLYNEILDAVPTYYGIEPPEIFDGDHLMISRTTNVMVYGSLDAGPGILNYSTTTDNGEGDPNNLIPIAWDVNYRFGSGDYTIGTSGYISDILGDPTTANVGLGEGSPKSGVLPWMEGDEFTLFGGYAEAKIENLTLQVEYWLASHDAIRDPASVVMMINAANPNAAQRARFLKDANAAVEEANVDVEADYDIKTWYVRAGYSFETEIGEIGPYAQWDYYNNPETIAKKTYGGDNEAGFADDGKFSKGTIGVLFRPIPEVAIKLDVSSHFQVLNDEDTDYPEIRFDVSYIFGQ